MPTARASQQWVNVVVRGPLFSKRIDSVIKQAMIKECLEKIDARIERGTRSQIRKRGKWPSGRPMGLGAKRNIVTSEMAFGLAATEAAALRVKSTTKSPRSKGTSWVRKNIGITRAMAPRVLRAAAKRMVAELS